MLKPIGNMCLVIAFVAALTFRLDNQSFSAYASEHGFGPALTRLWSGPASQAASAPQPAASSPVDISDIVNAASQPTHAPEPTQVAHVEEREEIVEDQPQTHTTSVTTTVNRAQLTNNDFDEVSGRLEPGSSVYLCTYTKCLIDNDNDDEPDD